MQLHTGAFRRENSTIMVNINYKGSTIHWKFIRTKNVGRPIFNGFHTNNISADNVYLPTGN